MSENPEPGFRQLFDRDTWTYTYLLFDAEYREGLIIDPVREQFERDLRMIEELGIELKYVFDTHVHADHITSAGLFRRASGAKMVVGEPSGVPCADMLLKDGDELNFGRHRVRALSTPGHTDACTSLYTENRVFTGDALFISGCGRTDFQQGNPDRLYDSIHNKLYRLPDETLVCPGHDYRGCTVSTIGEEKRFNPRIPVGQTLQGFRGIMDALNLKPPQRIREAVPANLSCGMSLETGHSTETNFSMDDLYRTLENLTPRERVVDVRTPGEFAQGHVPNSLNIPMGNEAEFMDELRGYEKVFLYCHSGRRAQTIYTLLSRQGFNNLVCICSSGITNWISAGYPLNKEVGAA